MDERRTVRVAEAIREELLQIIGFEMDDPRIKGVEITRIEVTADSRNATVHVAVQGDEKEQKAILKALRSAAGYLRHEVAQRVDLRHMPELRFDLDKFLASDSRIDLLLKRAEKSRGKD